MPRYLGSVRGMISAFSQVSVSALEHEKVLVQGSMLTTIARSPGLVLQEREDDAAICLLALVKLLEEFCGD